MKTVYVDIPQEDSDIYLNVAVFYGDSAKEQAIDYAQKQFGADEEGRINLISVEEGEEE